MPAAVSQDVIHGLQLGRKMSVRRSSSGELCRVRGFGPHSGDQAWAGLLRRKM